MDEFTPEFIAEQLAIAEKATPRPWKQSLDRVYYKVHDSVGFQEWTSMNAHYLDGSPVDDSAYIVAAANNYPAALEEIARLREAQRWIPVGERLPEEYGAYIGWNGEMYIGFTFGDWSTQCPEGVTHWKMLPQTPQEDDNENNR